MGRVLPKIDTFGANIPTFNLRGKTQVHTLAGGVLTFVITVIMLVYATIKLLQLATKDNPTVSEFTETSFFDYND